MIELVGIIGVVSPSEKVVHIERIRNERLGHRVKVAKVMGCLLHSPNGQV